MLAAWLRVWVGFRDGRLAIAAVGLAIVAPAGLAAAADLGPDEREKRAATRTGTAASRPVAADRLAAAPTANDPKREVESRRTARSETFALGDGSLRTRVFDHDVNFRDSAGRWQPIDNRLEAVGPDRYRTRANSTVLTVPRELSSEPVRVESGKDRVTFQLVGAARSAGEVSGGQAAFRDVYPGVDVSYAVAGSVVKESLVLRGPSAKRSFIYDLRASAGLTVAEAADGGLVVKDGKGGVVFELAAPFAFDSARPRSSLSTRMRYAVAGRGAGRWEVSTALDDDWVRDAGVRWPVTVDPTVRAQGPSQDCTITNYSQPWNPNPTTCSASGYQQLYAGMAGDDPTAIYRPLVKFGLSFIPADAYVSTATFGVHTADTASEPSSLELAPLVKPWTTAASWQNYATGSPWTTAGGDVGSPAAVVTAAARGTAPGWWNFTSEGTRDWVQRWVSGTAVNNGFRLKTSEDFRNCAPDSDGVMHCDMDWMRLASGAAVEAAIRPFLDVTYFPRAPDSSKLTSPGEGEHVAKRVELAAAWTAAGVPGGRFQYRLNATAPWQDVPASDVRDKSNTSVSWPVAAQGTSTPPVYWNAPATDEAIEVGAKVQVRAVLEGPQGAGGYTKAVNVVVDRDNGGTRDATESVGPGSVDLLTGSFSMTSADVSLPGFGSELAFSRTYRSRGAGPTGVLGPGWEPGTPVEEAGGADWMAISDAQAGDSGSYALLKDPQGGAYAFAIEGASYVSPEDAPDLKLTRQDASHLLLQDSDGNATRFELTPGQATEYKPIEISQTGGSGNKTRMVYELLADNKRRLSKLIAPTPAGVTCTDQAATTTNGCRVLSFAYAGASQWGQSFTGERLSTITAYSAGYAGAMQSAVVARYEYDANGYLAAEFDPRISPNLREQYSYTNSVLTGVRPPGQEPWTLGYGAIAGDPNYRRLKTASRPSLNGGTPTATTTIAYDVPLSGTGAPYAMSGSGVAAWGQDDVPVDATAVFAPDQVPSDPALSYPKATVHYLDADGQEINEAAPGGRITTSEKDEHGNVVRELTAENRRRALQSGSSATRGRELDTRRSFSGDGTEMLEEWGPLHQIKDGGATVDARRHTVLQYDQGWPAPAGQVKPHLVTTSIVGANYAGADHDTRQTDTRYDWTLRQPTQKVIDPGGKNLETRTVYDPTSGLATQVSLPANPAGGDAHTTRTVYYTAGTNSITASCGNKPQWANLACTVAPMGAGGAGLPDLLTTTTTSYNEYAQPTVTVENGGSGSQYVSRTTFRSYDAAARPTDEHISYASQGTPVPDRQLTYDPANGQLKTERFVDDCEEGCEPFEPRAVTRSYDTLGRITSYTDADANTATTSYDLLGRPTATNDGKGTQTRSYDPTTGDLTGLDDSGVGSFGAGYDADGKLTSQTLPNGLTATTSYDETASPVAQRYQKTTNCTTGCTWFDEQVTENIHGQWIAHSSDLSAQTYDYDKIGRLSSVKDTPQGQGCTTRSYSHDADSNRTALVTRQPGAGGACDTASTGATQTSSYDNADRLSNPGVVYDGFGRTTALPAAQSGGGTLATGYYANDLVRTQTQDGVTNTYDLDGALRQRSRTRSGAGAGSETYHYSDGSDSPAWTDQGFGGASWTRNVEGIDGALTATQTSAGTITFGLANLHGDTIAETSANLTATAPTTTFETTEFGTPRQPTNRKYGWLGAKQRRTELPSGVIQMGVRSYIPAIGRFTSVDPVAGGSANDYDYANQDPINNLDLDGKRARYNWHYNKTLVLRDGGKVRARVLVSASISFNGRRVRTAFNTRVLTGRGFRTTNNTISCREEHLIDNGCGQRRGNTPGLRTFYLKDNANYHLDFFHRIQGQGFKIGRTIFSPQFSCRAGRLAACAFN